MRRQHAEECSLFHRQQLSSQHQVSVISLTINLSNERNQKSQALSDSVTLILTFLWKIKQFEVRSDANEAEVSTQTSDVCLDDDNYR